MFVIFFYVFFAACFWPFSSKKTDKPAKVTDENVESGVEDQFNEAKGKVDGYKNQMGQSFDERMKQLDDMVIEQEDLLNDEVDSSEDELESDVR